MQYLKNLIEDQGTAIAMYNQAREIINNIFRAESQRRIDILVIRVIDTLLPISNPKVDQDRILFANDRLLSISDGKRFRLIETDDNEGESDDDGNSKGKGKLISGNSKGKDKSVNGKAKDGNRNDRDNDTTIQIN